MTVIAVWMMAALQEKKRLAVSGYTTHGKFGASQKLLHKSDFSFFSYVNLKHYNFFTVTSDITKQSVSCHDNGVYI